MEKNHHIIRYLDYYISLPHPPEYALLLRGKWGCGKSYFIDKYIEDFPKRQKGKLKKTKFLKISLYGVSSKADIDDLLFQQIHPFLASKGMKIFGGIVKGLLKTTIRLDITGDRKDDFNINSTLPELEVFKEFKKLENKVLVFDDLERCSMNPNEILGYINQLVENDNQKAIILANEEELLKQEIPKERKQDYKLIKEKLIGKSFDIIPDEKAAFKAFLENIQSKKVKELFEKKSNLILSVYSRSMYNNLRHLRQSLEYFEIFFECLPELAFEREEVLDHIIELFFIISIEIKSSSIDEKTIENLFPQKFFVAQKIDKNSLVAQIINKYPVLEKTVLPISILYWKEFFRLGFSNPSDLENDIRSSPYFFNHNTPAWQKLWYFFDLEDDEFALIERKVFKDLEEKNFGDPFALAQVVGIYFSLINNKLISRKIDKILEYASQNILALKSKGKLEFKIGEGELKYVSHGMKFQSLDQEKFIEFIEFILNQAKEAEQLNFPKKVEKLIEDLEESVENFGEQISFHNSSKSIYADIPILKNIPPAKFINLILSLTNKDKIKLSEYLQKRYQFAEVNRRLLDEKEWLNNLKFDLIKRNEEMSTKPSSIVLKFQVIKSIEDSIERLNAIKQN